MMQTSLVPIIHALIIDDHQLVRDGLKTMLGSLKFSYHFEISEAENGEEAIRKIRKRNFDIIIIDYQLPGMSGAETVEQIRRNLPQAKIIALSNYNELQNIKSMMDAGANGYILKNVEPSGLLSAIRTILNGKSYYSSEVANKLLDDKNKEMSISVIKPHRLTKRELEVLKMIAMEMTNEEIAEKLYVGKRTVDTHRQNLLNKLQVKNTAGLVKAAYKLNLI